MLSPNLSATHICEPLTGDWCVGNSVKSIAFLLLLLLFAFAGSLGVQNVSVSQVFKVMADHLLSEQLLGSSELDRRILLYLRLPVSLWEWWAGRASPLPEW